MIDRKIDAIPVVEGERLVGLVTSTDLLALLVEDETKQPLPFDFDLEDAEGGQAVA
jgi:CBS domain-containing protein